jgi:hypothetical protein
MLMTTEHTTKYTTNVHIPGRVDGSIHRVRLTVDSAGAVRWAEHYVDGVLKGCGPTHTMLPLDVREHVESRLGFSPPPSFPMYWRAD